MPETRGDGRLFEGRERKAASVLVPLVERDDGLTVLLTRRTAHLRDHAGQISFPGGRAESTDATPSPRRCARPKKKSAWRASMSRCIGSLPELPHRHAYVVTPVVALVRPTFTLALDAFEVAEAFEVPLSFLMTPAHHQRHVFEAGGHRREFLSMPWPRPDGRGEPLLHLGRDRRDAAQPVPLSQRLSGCVSSRPMSFFAVLFALLIEQLRPLPRDNWVHDTLVSWVGWTGRNFDAGRERHASSSGASRCWCRHWPPLRCTRWLRTTACWRRWP